MGLQILSGPVGQTLPLQGPLSSRHCRFAVPSSPSRHRVTLTAAARWRTRGGFKGSPPPASSAEPSPAITRNQLPLLALGLPYRLVCCCCVASSEWIEVDHGPHGLMRACVCPCDSLLTNGRRGMAWGWMGSANGCCLDIHWNVETH